MIGHPQHRCMTIRRMERLDAIMAEIRSRATSEVSEDASDAAPGASKPRIRPRRTSHPRSTTEAPPNVVRKTGFDRRRIIVLAVLALVLIVLVPAIVQGVRAGVSKAGSAGPSRHPRASDAGPAVPSDAATDVAPSASRWLAIIGQLDAARARAIVARDAALLSAADAPGSAALARDTEIIAALRREGLRASAVPLRVLSVREVAVSVGSASKRAVLEVEDVMDAYTLRGRGDRRIPARSRVRWRVELRNVPGVGWRMLEVTRATTPRAR